MREGLTQGDRRNVAQPQFLPGPTSELWEWQLHGACRGENSDVFYHPDGERGRARAQRENRAKAICSGCPVIELCREHALASAEPYGVWGGMSETERTIALRSRRNRAKVTV
ncbi:transcription factor WhiB [Corynebacterium sp. CMW7794]|nr:WhiB family transcriptional regulator [Corynebacterium phoceense]KXB56095.1 transcription factor WhiB [Corynebacterium sp. DNF00584]KXI18078.1 transcription factor WhiB [Corynebacterium sp. CMW7794]MCQ9331254.1 WhiB family transcriptional regulator [Corynebacterium phoceense]MCQ9347652.1 WhiB family transcriptional regulator [Corynebacterium phoceense]